MPHSPAPMIMPSTTVGGSKATDTITPTSASDTRLTNDNAPAEPAARAIIISITLTSVRERNSVLESGAPNMTPNPIAITSGINTPRVDVKSERRINFKSPSKAAKLSAVNGPISGAITIAPMTTAALSLINPAAATRLDKTSIQR